MRNRDTKRWSIPATVRDVRPNQRSYVLQTTVGGVFLRNRRFIKPRSSEELDGGDKDQSDDSGQGEEEEDQVGQEEREVSSFSGVSTGQEPIGTAGQERALREQEGRRAEAGVRGRPEAGEKAGARLPTPRLAHPQPGTGSGERRSYKQALCDPPVSRMITRSMAKQA